MDKYIFHRPGESAGLSIMQLRQYQSDAVNATWNFLRDRSGNPIIVLPCGAGKSIVIAKMCEDALAWGGRVLVVCHRKELIEQDHEKIKRLMPTNTNIGIYSAGLGKRHLDHDVVVCGIQSVYNKAYDFGKRDLVIVDECHLTPLNGEGMFRTFLTDLRTANEKIRYVGTTATPFRLDVGEICRPDSMFQKVCFSADIAELIDNGYLCKLTTQPSQTKIDTSSIHIRGGEFIQSEVEGVFNQATEAACTEIVTTMKDRKSILIFCSGVKHAQNVAQTINRLTGESCGVVIGDTIPLERAATLEEFRSRKLRFLVGCDVLTTGFDAPVIDAIALLRCTLSPGLYSQMVGRGFRVYPEKSNCLIADFGGNILRHGPIDNINFGRNKKLGDIPGEAPTKICVNCEAELLIACRECPECGFIFPIERKPIDTTASEEKILSEPVEYEIESVTYTRHEKKKEPGPPTMRVDYMIADVGNLKDQHVSEWVCFEHDGFAAKKAAGWWRSRSFSPVPATVDEAVRLANCGALAWPMRIVTRREGRWNRVTSVVLNGKPTEWVNDPEDLLDIPF